MRTHNYHHGNRMLLLAVMGSLFLGCSLSATAQNSEPGRRGFHWSGLFSSRGSQEEFHLSDRDDRHSVQPLGRSPRRPDWHSKQAGAVCPYERRRSERGGSFLSDWRRGRFQETSWEQTPNRFRGLRDPFRDPGGSALDDYLTRHGYRPDRDTESAFPLLPRNNGRSDILPDLRNVPGGSQRNGIPNGDYDPLTPPLPRREGSDDAATLAEWITARYRNPVHVRTVRSLSADQGLQLYREVSLKTDARHLEPSSYDLRVRRGLRNLGLLLENRAAASALGLSTDSFRTDGFRDVLARIWDSMNVRSRQDAERVVQTVMRHAERVPGLTPGAVAFEFANATVDTLDRFSALEPEEPQASPSAALESEMVGVGVEIREHEDGLSVVRVLRGSPAAQAGLKSGDIITAINRRSIAGMSMAQSVDLMKGPSGTTVRFDFRRGSDRTGTVQVTRRRFRVWSVNDVRLMPGTQVGYLSLSQFAQSSTEEVDQALRQLYRRGMKSLVLDLRGNPGGLLTTCVRITDRFLPCGTIVSTKGRLSSDNMRETATYDRTWDVPLVVLIDGDSASASEILAAAIQDNRRGIVVGQKSYGKGTVQTHFPLQTIHGNLRLTTARFYSPDGRAMSGRGVTPDVPVADDDGPADGDRVLETAVRIAQSRELKDMAVAAGRCRIRRDPGRHRSFHGALFDAIPQQTVRR